jgi:hypothetical protein
MTSSGGVDVMRLPAIMAILEDLRIPEAALLGPRTRRLRERGYPGTTCELLGAFIGHMVRDDPGLTALTPLILPAFLAGSYFERKK